MAGQTMYFITGANRGIGLGLVKLYLARPNHVVVCAVRDTSADTAKALLKLPAAEGSKAILVKVDSEYAKTDAPAAVEELESKHGITHIDVVIPVAGIYKGNVPISELSSEVLLHLFNVNTCGPLEVYKATRGLLLKSKNPRFVPISGLAASLSQKKTGPVPLGGYGASKAGLNSLAKYIHFEDPNLISFPLHPGVVKTDMTSANADPEFEKNLASLGLNLISVEQCANSISKVIDEATRKDTSGNFMGYNGEVIPW